MPAEDETDGTRPIASTSRQQRQSEIDRSTIRELFTDFAPITPLTSPKASKRPLPHHRRRASSRGSITVQPVAPSAPDTRAPSGRSLHETQHDLQGIIKAFLRLLPFLPKGSPVREFLKNIFAPPFRVILRVMARALHSRNLYAGDIMYDLLVLLFKWIINLFFREIKPRGAHNIPRQGPVIFVAGPHHNQFLDPLNLMAESRLNAGRRISFLIAEKSMNRAFIGLMARLMQSIPVGRAADAAKAGSGLIYLEPGSDGLILKGHKSRFTKELGPRKQIMLSKYFDNAVVMVDSVIDDQTCKLCKPFSGKPKEALEAAGQRIAEGKTDGEIAQPKRGIQPEGLTYKHMPYIDQAKMYSSVYTKLKEGGCIGIFPEGGSHDQTDLLPLKAGVAIMALGAMSQVKGLKVKIVPVGLSYFHAHRFRSRAVVEFGTPLDITPELVQEFEQGGEKKRAAVGKVLDIIFDGLKSVTVRAPDYETLMVIQAARRMYKPPGQQLSLGQVVELNRRFIAGYLKYQDEPRIKALKAEVQSYNHDLKQLGLKDHQVDRANRPYWKSLVLLLYRTGLVSAWTVLALPGVILNAPMFIAASIVSRQKAKEALAASTVKVQARDVVATWKVLVSLGMAPVLYSFYVAGATIYAYRAQWSGRAMAWVPIGTVFAIGCAGYSSLRFGETGMDIYKSLRPLFLTLTGNHQVVEKIRTKREDLVQRINEIIEELGPQVFEDFDAQRVIPSAALPPTDGKAPRKSSADQGLLSHPFEWLDDHIFGWSRNNPEPRSGIATPSTPASATSFTQPLHDSDEEEADYETVIGMMPRSKSMADLRRRPSQQQGSPTSAFTSARESATLDKRKGTADDGDTD